MNTLQNFLPSVIFSIPLLCRSLNKIAGIIFFLTTCFSFQNSLAGWHTVPTGTSAYLTSCFFIDEMTGYIGGLNGFLSKTTNGGVSWTIQNPLMGSQFVRDISFVNASTGYLCGDDGLIRKTTDGGSSWMPQSTNTASGIYSIDAIDAKNVYASVNNGSILRSTDGGASYNTINVSQNQLLTIDFSSRDTGYAAGQGGVVYKTTNAGISWNLLNASTLNNFWDICALNNNSLYLAAYYGTLRKTDDAGENFIPSYAQDVLFEDIQMVNSMIGYACALNGVILKSTNGGITWDAQASGTSESLNELFFVDSKTGYIAGTNGMLLKTTDGGDDFNIAVISPNNGETLISGTTAKIKWSSTFQGNARIEFSSDGGLNWNVIQNAVTAEEFEYDWLIPVMNSSSSKVRITSVDNPAYSDASDGTFSISATSSFYSVPDLLYYKFNNGTITTPNYAVPGQIFGSAEVTGMSMLSGGIADSCLVGQGGSGLTNFVSANWATNFPASGWTIGFWVSDISLGKNPNNAVYLFSDITANNLRCYYGGALGLTAQDTAIMLRCTGLADIRVPVVQGRSYYIHFVYDAISASFKTYVNGELTQSVSQSQVLPIGNGPFRIGASANFSSSLAAGMKLDEFRVYSRPLDAAEIAATWNVTFPVIITGVAGNVIEAPGKFTLHNNYPNPFNPSTTISFDLPEDFSNVRLAVFDAVGKESIVLLDGPLKSGRHSVFLNAGTLPSGVYFYELVAGSYSSVKKMVLIK